MPYLVKRWGARRKRTFVYRRRGVRNFLARPRYFSTRAGYRVPYRTGLRTRRRV